jgi:hypothetical protein
MISNDEKNYMEVTVLTDLAGICKKLADNQGLPDQLRIQARQFGEAYDVLGAHKGKGTSARHQMGEELLMKIARFLPRVLEVRADPSPQAVNE